MDGDFNPGVSFLLTNASPLCRARMKIRVTHVPRNRCRSAVSNGAKLRSIDLLSSSRGITFCHHSWSNCCILQLLLPLYIEALPAPSAFHADERIIGTSLFCCCR